jgi:hypothetical protein
MRAAGLGVERIGQQTSQAAALEIAGAGELCSVLEHQDCKSGL